MYVDLQYYIDSWPQSINWAYFLPNRIFILSKDLRLYTCFIFLIPQNILEYVKIFKL